MIEHQDIAIQSHLEEAEQQSNSPLSIEQIASAIMYAGRINTPYLYTNTLLTLHTSLYSKSYPDTLANVALSGTFVAEKFGISQETLNRRIRALRAGAEQPEDQSIFQFVPIFREQTESDTYHKKKKEYVIPHPITVQLLALDLLAKGYRTTQLRSMAIELFGEQIEPMLSYLYACKTIPQLAEELGVVYNTVTLFLSKSYPNWRESFPMKSGGETAGRTKTGIYVPPEVVMHLKQALHEEKKKSIQTSHIKPKRKKAPSHMPKNKKTHTKEVKRTQIVDQRSTISDPPIADAVRKKIKITPHITDHAKAVLKQMRGHMTEADMLDFRLMLEQRTGKHIPLSVAYALRAQYISSNRK